MNYGAMTRMRVRTAVEFNKDGTVKEGSEKFGYEDKYLAEAMFGDVVIKPIMADWYDGKISFEAGDENGVKVTKRAEGKAKDSTEKETTFQEYLNSSDARVKILKNVCRAGLAAQLRAHRSWTGLDERWDAHTVRKFYEALRSMPQYIEDPLTGKEVRIDGSQFFDKEYIDWIRINSGTTHADLMVEEIGATVLDILSESLPGALKTFYSGTFEN